MKGTLDLSHLKAFVRADEIDALTGQYAHLLQEAAAGMPQYRDAAGWMDVETWASRAAIDRIMEKARSIRQDADAFVLIGVGGSNNAARAVIEALRPGGAPEIIYAGNSTAPSAIDGVLRRLEGKRVYLNIIAKNFETLEPGAAFRVLRKWMYDRYGAAAAGRIMATGTRGSRLFRLCEAHGWDFFTFPEDVGGRYSALTDVGLLPMAVAGVDIGALVSGAAQMRERLLSAPAQENPALRYAACRTLLAGRGYAVETLSFFEPRLAWFSKWWVQLFGESAGKDGKGLYPAACQFSEELHAMGQFLQEGSPVVMETFLRMPDETGGPALTPDGVDDGFAYLDAKRYTDLNDAAFRATLAAHATRLPCLVWETAPPSEETFGGLFCFFALACVFSCRMAGVNPFDQPGVEAYKQSMFASLGKEF